MERYDLQMFREIARKKQALSWEECAALLKGQTRGVLSLLGDAGYPYGVPMNYWYNEADGLIYFHSGLAGHKVDAMRQQDKASFCVFDQGSRPAGEWAWNVKSVIVFGRIRILENNDQTMEMIRQLSCKYTDDAAYIEEEIRKDGPHTLCFALVPEHITGKLVKEA